MTDSVSSIPSMTIGLPLVGRAAAQVQTAQDSNRPAAQARSAGPTAPAPAGAPRSAGETKAKADAARDLAEAVKSLQDYIKPQQQVDLAVDHDSGRSFVKIVDAKTQRMILQIPSEEVRAMARKLQELADQRASSGVLVDREG
jgi:flagellar protein FlaG